MVRQGGPAAPRKGFAVVLGCELSHALRMVCARGPALNDPDRAVPIGPVGKLCERSAWPRRAFLAPDARSPLPRAKILFVY